MSRRLALLICLLILAAPAPAVAQSPFGADPSQTPVQRAPAPAGGGDGVSDNGDDGGLAGWQEALIIVGGAVVLVVVGWAIVRDARRNAPVEERVGQAEARARREEEHHQRKAKARASGKRARAARKRNRSR